MAFVEWQVHANSIANWRLWLDYNSIFTGIEHGWNFVLLKYPKQLPNATGAYPSLLVTLTCIAAHTHTTKHSISVSKLFLHFICA